jgi:DNA-binding transcriptional LysR family regulator
MIKLDNRRIDLLIKQGQGLFYVKLAQIEYFLAASETLNFTAAAKTLYISQPALSKQIKAIEDEIGVRLFTRSKRRVCLTPAGVSFKHDLEVILTQLDSAVEKVKLINREQIGIIRIGCFQGAAVEDLIYQISEKSIAQMPQTKIIFLRGGFREIREMLKNNEVDIILTLDFEMKELYIYKSKVVFSKRTALVYSDKSMLAETKNICMDDFSKVPLLTLSAEASYGANHNSVNIIRKLGLVNQKIETYKSWETMLTYLKMGHGFTVMFENVNEKMNGLRQFMIPQTDFLNSIVAVWKDESLILDRFIFDCINNL